MTINSVLGSPGYTPTPEPAPTAVPNSAVGPTPHPQWSPENENQVKTYIEQALARHNGDVALAFQDLRDQRQQPANYYDTNMAIAADYLRARWDTQLHGADAERMNVDAYLALRCCTTGVSVLERPWVHSRLLLDPRHLRGSQEPKSPMEAISGMQGQNLVPLS
jgi:hypothetical protein